MSFVQDLKWWLKLRLARRNCFKKNLVPKFEKLHLGCGTRHFGNWVNVDGVRSDLNLDLSQGKLPWENDCFKTIVSQHVIEHLELHSELIPLFRELHRVVRPGGRVWLSCPDMEVVCAGYQADKGARILASVQRRHPSFELAEGAPTQQVVNYLFHQKRQHRNLFDFELLEWALKHAGFSKVTQANEQELIENEPDVAHRDDDDISLYVFAEK